jgi:hypothetical protein
VDTKKGRKMATIKAELTPELNKRTGELVASKLKKGGKLLISITHVSQSGMSYRYKVSLAYQGFDGKLQIDSLNYWLASCWNEKLHRGFFDELKGNGLGTDRYFLAAYNIGLTLKEFGLIDDPYEIANRRTYQEI